MKRCAVVIGVNKTGDLPVLHAAASGAKEFADWATTQGIDVTLLTDNNDKVSLGSIKAAMRKYVQQRTFSQLIVFFSGHGVLRAPDYELWLLSGAPDDPDDAVNVPASIWLARNVGIPHVVFISDACRSRPNTTRLSQVQGGVLFPNESPKAPRPVVDVFYAALPGDPALEVSANDATENYRGLFTECLLKGLNGTVPDLIVNIGDSSLKQEKWVVPSWELKPYLEQVVPDAAATVHIKLQQSPDIRVESHPPNYLAELARPSSTPVSRTGSIAPDLTTFRHIQRRRDVDQHGQGHIQTSAPASNAKTIAARSKMTGAINRLLAAKGRESFETQTGFSVIGTVVEQAVVSASHCDLFGEKGTYHVRVHSHGPERKPRSALIRMKGGSIIPLAVLPGYIGTVVVERGRVVTVTYLPSRNSSDYSEYQQAADAIERRRAYIAVASRNGSFRLDGEIEAIEAARTLRTLKTIDPTLGLYSAYAYAQVGDFEGIQSVFSYMSSRSEPVLFDVAMLANKLDVPARNGEGSYSVTPFCPMLTQGWAYVDVNEVWMPDVVRQARDHLRPGLWTTFEKRGAAKLWSYVEDGGVI